MLLSTRDAQRESQATQIIGALVAAERRLSFFGIDNASFQDDSVSELAASSTKSSRRPSQVEVPLPPIAITDDILEEQTSTDENRSPVTSKRKYRYRWKMTHYFYIHIALFIINGFLCGLIIYLIENYSVLRNQQIEVPYIDAWFVSTSCVYNCGLTTIDFAKLSQASQIILMFFTFISGITISTLPALIVKAHTHRKVEGLTVDDDHGGLDEDLEDELPTFNIQRRRNLPQNIRDKLASLPTPAQLRYRAYITCIVLILGTCFTIYLTAFFAIGGWLQAQYTSEQLLQGNSSVNPWFISFIVTITGFNQNGLTPFSDGFSRFVSDVYLNLFVMLLVMGGTSFFPFILRNVVMLMRRLAPFHYKIIFDYILMNNHRLSTLLFPAVQTRIYLLITFLLYILGVGISLILDLNSDSFATYLPGTRVLIFMFQTVNSRFAGFQTVDMNLFAAATLIVYLMLMATKPQMLCALDESPFELSWLAIQARGEVDVQTNRSGSLLANLNLPIRNRSETLSSGSQSGVSPPMKHMEQFLRRQSLVTKDLVRQQFANNTVSNGETRRFRHLRILRTRLFLIYFVRALIKHAFSFVILTRTWLFFFIFLICAIEHGRMAPVDPNLTVFKVTFETISAFGAVGLTLGYPNVASSFATVLSPASKTILVITMLMGRHRGLLASMKDQEKIEHSAADLLHRRRQEVLDEYEQTRVKHNPVNEPEIEERIVRF